MAVLSREEFVRLAMAEIDAVDRVAHSLTRDAATAADLVQDTYLNALKASGRFELEAYGIRPWLLRILHNVHINRVKRDRREPAGLSGEQLDAVVGAESSAQSPAEDIARGEGPLVFDDAGLNAALDALPAELRTILILWAVDELSYKQIAEVLSVPIGTVMSRLHRARQRLGQLLADHPDASRRKNAGAME
jgi:RNA polymerase sigma-70 factor (ECF subfamily)